MKVFLRTVAPFLGTMAITAAMAATPPAALAANQGSQSGNPYLPSHGHSYRHGAMPTIGAQGQIRAWYSQHGQAGSAGPERQWERPPTPFAARRGGYSRSHTRMSRATSRT